MSLRQILILGVAAIAALGALFLVKTASQPAAASGQVVIAPVPGTRVLIATKDIAAGTLLQPNDLEWRVWNKEAVSGAFIDQSKRPAAIEEVTGAVARLAIAQGEPVQEERIVKPGEQGFMAAMVRSGYRAVAVPITQQSAASGFILPGDRVDIVLTRRLSLGSVGGPSSEEVRSGVVLQDVRVLAIDQKYTRPDGEEPQAQPGSVALLELTLSDAEALATADELGDLSLALRSVRDVKPDRSTSLTGRGLEQESAARDQIRLHSFGTVEAVTVPHVGNGNTP